MQNAKRFIFTLIFGACANIIIMWYFTLREHSIMEYMLIKESTPKLRISAHRTQTSCNAEALTRVVKFGYAWAIPKDAEKPVDKRIKTGKYIKS